MKKIILAMAAVSTLAIAAPAAAQNANANTQASVQQLQVRLQAGVRSGSISRQEAVTLRQQLNQLTRLERQYARNGLTRSERNDVQRRIQAVRQELRSAERNRDDRYGRNDNGRGADNRYDGRAGQRYQGNYGGAPSQYGNQYRDTDRHYYRYDNAGRIYQVDRSDGIIVHVTDVRR